MKTLVLNADSMPLSIIDIRRSVVLESRSSNMTVLCYYNEKLQSSRGEVKIPAVMIYSRYVKISYKKTPTKKAIRIRDNNECGYCKILLNCEDFTIDHIVPISRFSIRSKANTWENQISCCKKCNLKKGNRTPEEAGMQLLKKPRKIERFFLVENMPREWQSYLTLF
jgi:5-methylcytosine-specific restriction endonuclease McrA